MNALDRDGLDGLWKTGTAPAPSRDALRGVASVRLWGDAGDDYTEEVSSAENDTSTPTAQVSVDAPPLIEFNLPEPPPRLPGERTRWRSLFNGIALSLLLVGLVLMWRSEPDAPAPPVANSEPAAPQTDEPSAAIDANHEVNDEFELEPALTGVEEVPSADPIGDLIATQNAPPLQPVAEALIEVEEKGGLKEENEKPETVVKLSPATASEVENTVPDLSRRVDFPGTFAAGGHLPEIDDPKPWHALVTALRASTDPISLIGHTDVDGTHPKDRDTAWLRGDSVRALLVELGLDRDRIAVLSAGTLRPASSNNNESGRASNRRVEVLYTAPATD